MVRECESCGGEYDDKSPEKREAGGLIIHCPDCSDETAVPYLGVNNASGKMQGVEILAFETMSDRTKYLGAWHKNVGQNKGKSSPLGNAGGLTGIKFRKVASFGGNPNHKGKDN